MNNMNNVDSQKSGEKSDFNSKKEVLPESSPDAKKGVRQGTGEKKDLNKTNDDLATSGRRDFSTESNDDEDQSNEKQDEKKRYDEADPNWTEPDVQMQKNEINPELES